MSKPPFSDMEVHFLIDGQLAPEERRRMEADLAQDDELMHEAQELRQLKTLVREAYATVPPPNMRQPAPRSRQPFAAMAAILLLCVGVAGGWFLHALGGFEFLGSSSAVPKGVVIQVSDNDPAKWQMALINAKNVQKAYGGSKVAIEIVAYGPGLNMLLADSPVAPSLSAAAESGVKLLACGSTMEMMHTTRQQLNHAVGIVPMGITEIMQRQREGYSYVRP